MLKNTMELTEEQVSETEDKWTQVIWSEKERHKITKLKWTEPQRTIGKYRLLANLSTF